MIDARPHPGPLPQEREGRSPLWFETRLGRRTQRQRFAVNVTSAETCARIFNWPLFALPLLGERVGVRADQLH
jgi:hypothetical protein